MIRYLLTISCQQKKNYVSQLDLDDILLWLKMNVPELKIYEHVYETSGRYSQLHFHGIVTTPASFYFKPFTQWGDLEHNSNTFRLQWIKVYDYIGACAYVQKDLYIQSQDQILIRNYFKHFHFCQDLQMYTQV